LCAGGALPFATYTHGGQAQDSRAQRRRAARRPGRRTGLYVLAELVDVGAARLGQQDVVAEVVDLHLLKVEHLVLRVRRTSGGPRRAAG